MPGLVPLFSLVSLVPPIIRVSLVSPVPLFTRVALLQWPLSRMMKLD
jgi:hypothetical protein